MRSRASSCPWLSGAAPRYRSPALKAAYAAIESGDVTALRDALADVPAVAREAPEMLVYCVHEGQLASLNVLLNTGSWGDEALSEAVTRASLHAVECLQPLLSIATVRRRDGERALVSMVAQGRFDAADDITALGVRVGSFWIDRSIRITQSSSSDSLRAANVELLRRLCESSDRWLDQAAQDEIETMVLRTQNVELEGLREAVALSRSVRASGPFDGLSMP